MKNTYQLKMTYLRTFSLHTITSMVESVSGVRIQGLRFTSEGKYVDGILTFEASDRMKFLSVRQLIASRDEVLILD